MMLFFMLGALLGWLLMSGAWAGFSEQHEEFRELAQRVKGCPPYKGYHDWTYHPVTGRLTCTKCGFEAGT